MEMPRRPGSKSSGCLLNLRRITPILVLRQPEAQAISIEGTPRRQGTARTAAESPRARLARHQYDLGLAWTIDGKGLPREQLDTAANHGWIRDDEHRPLSQPL